MTRAGLLLLAAQAIAFVAGVAAIVIAVTLISVL